MVQLDYEGVKLGYVLHHSHHAMAGPVIVLISVNVIVKLT